MAQTFCMKHPKPSGRLSRTEGLFCVDCLWEITDDVPVTIKPKAELERFMRHPFWLDGSPSAILVQKSMPDVGLHAARVEKASLDFPILLVIYADRSLDILDGVHRLCKAILHSDSPTVAVRLCDPLVFQRVRRRMRGGLRVY